MALIRLKIALTLLLTVAAGACPAGAAVDHFQNLQQRLIRDGFDAATVRQLYRSPQVDFETRGVSMYFVHQESRLNYGQFLENEPVSRARAYLKTHETAMVDAELAYGVHRQVIAAILLVETRLGTFVGTRRVFNTLSTMAAIGDPDVRKSLWNRVKGNTRLSFPAFEEKARQKSNWAYGELKAFLTFTRQQGIDPLSVYGSYAGAMGYCQFLPSNALTLARDGDGDGKIDLFSHADAIMSVASYLKRYGWRTGMTAEDAYQAVYSYNHSKYYVDTVLKIADRLKQ